MTPLRCRAKNKAKCKFHGPNSEQFIAETRAEITKKIRRERVQRAGQSGKPLSLERKKALEAKGLSIFERVELEARLREIVTNHEETAAFKQRKSSHGSYYAGQDEGIRELLSKGP